MRVETRVFNLETVRDPTSPIEPDGGSIIPRALQAAKLAHRETAKPPDRLLQETEQTPEAHKTTSSSLHSGAWAEATASEVGGLETEGTFL